MDREKIVIGLKCMIDGNVPCKECGYSKSGHGTYDCKMRCASEVLTLLKEQDSVEYALDVLRRNGWKDDSYGDLLKEQEPIKPTINEYGEAYCVCGENIGIIPSSNSLPKIRSKYCSECGRRMKWNE